MRIDGPPTMEPIFNPDVDMGDVVIAERGVGVVLHVVEGSHSVVQLVKQVPHQHGEVDGLRHRGALTARLPSCYGTIVLVVIILLIFIAIIHGVTRVSSSSGRCWSH